MTNKNNKEWIDFKCPICEETGKININNDEIKFDGGFTSHGIWISDELGEFVCEGCEQSDRESASTIIRYSSNGSKEVVQFGEFTVNQTEPYWDEAPEWFEKYFDGREWISSDAWRGHYESKFKNNFIKLADGWITGYIDETISHKKASADLFNFLEDKTNRHSLPAPIYWLFEPTSNVFSTASEIFVDKKDENTIIRWLENNEFNIIDVKNSFR